MTPDAADRRTAVMPTRHIAPSRIAALAVLVAAGAAACGPGQGAAGTSVASVAPEPPGASTAPSTGPDDSGPLGGTVIPEPILEQVIQDAAARTGGEPSAVVVVEARSVTWPNGAAGCPQPDMLYTDALV